MLLLRVDDLGRGPDDPPDRGTDNNLDRFFRWRDAARLYRVTCVYGAVPTWVNEAGQRRLESELYGCEHVAVHGWDHSAVPVTQVQMATASERFLSYIYIPPFNDYDARTVSDWALVGGRYFFGGFDGEHHHRGGYPTRIGTVVHVPACRGLYGRASELVSRVRPVPFAVVTLHFPWEHGHECARDLVDRMVDYPSTLEDIGRYVDRIRSGSMA